MPLRTPKGYYHIDSRGDTYIVTRVVSENRQLFRRGTKMVGSKDRAAAHDELHEWITTHQEERAAQRK